MGQTKQWSNQSAMVQRQSQYYATNLLIILSALRSNSLNERTTLKTSNVLWYAQDAVHPVSAQNWIIKGSESGCPDTTFSL